MPKNEPVTWIAIKQWWPVLGAVIGCVIAFGSILTRLAVIEARLSSIEKTQQELKTFMQDKYVSEETRYGNLSLRVNRLETLEGIR